MTEQLKPKLRFVTNEPIDAIASHDGPPAGPKVHPEYGEFFIFSCVVNQVEHIAFATRRLSELLATVRQGDNVRITKVEREREDGQGLYRGWDVLINGHQAAPQQLQEATTLPPPPAPQTPQAPVQAVTRASTGSMDFGELDGLMGHCLNTAKQTWNLIMDDVNSDAIQRMAVSMAIACLDRNIRIAAPPTSPTPTPTGGPPAAVESKAAAPQQQAAPIQQPPQQNDDLPF